MVVSENPVIESLKRDVFHPKISNIPLIGPLVYMRLKAIMGMTARKPAALPPVMDEMSVVIPEMKMKAGRAIRSG